MPNNRDSGVEDADAIFRRTSWWLFCGVIISLGFIQLRIPFGPYEIGLTELLVGVSVPFWCIELAKRGLKRPSVSTAISIAVYLSTGTLSALLSGSSKSSLKHVLGEVYLALLFFLAANMIDDQGKVKSAILSWLIGLLAASLVALLTILVFYAAPDNPLLFYLTYHYGAVPVGNFPRVTATFVSASMLFNYLSIGIVLLICSYRNGWISQRYFYPSLVAALATAVFTFSIGLGSLFLIFAWWGRFGIHDKSKVRYATYISALASVTWLVLAFVSIQQFPEVPFQYSLPSVGTPIYPSARYLVWREVLQTIGDHFFIGVGPGVPVCNVIFTNTDGSVSLLTDAHNIFLNVMAERGVFGFAAFIIAICLVMRPGFDFFYQKSRDSAQTVSTSVAFAIFISVVYQGLVGSFEDARHVWVLLGIAIASNDVASRKRFIAD